jgi:hypothetical protein
VRHP